MNIGFYVVLKKTTIVFIYKLIDYRINNQGRGTLNEKL